ncbi:MULTISPECIES: hypothetical protein [Flavobacteriaceae]|uniref:hypothetical protein n=1 Tax=Flavobacteriaceae TaxID=49546 RepID=UPI001067593C|nr:MULTISPECIES: hypothetical protein [Flavobacteriaceae]GGK49123.1 hypothetical protein GCM10007963_16760 [Lutibacter litoralis]
MFSAKYFYLIVFFISWNTCFSQEKNVDLDNKFLPKSIYVKNILNENNSTFLINNKLKLKRYKFLYQEVVKIEDGYFTIPLKNISKPSYFVFEAYKDYYNKRNLEKSFFDISKLYYPYIPKK